MQYDSHSFTCAFYLGLFKTKLQGTHTFEWCKTYVTLSLCMYKRYFLLWYWEYSWIQAFTCLIFHVSRIISGLLFHSDQAQSDRLRCLHKLFSVQLSHQSDYKQICKRFLNILFPWEMHQKLNGFWTVFHADLHVIQISATNTFNVVKMFLKMQQQQHLQHVFQVRLHFDSCIMHYALIK